jgi:hypothetical protein
MTLRAAWASESKHSTAEVRMPEPLRSRAVAMFSRRTLLLHHVSVVKLSNFEVDDSGQFIEVYRVLTENRFEDIEADTEEAVLAIIGIELAELENK